MSAQKPDAEKAISTLEAIRKQLGVAQLAYWVAPNTILTLSGARAYCDGVFWSNDKKTLEQWTKDIEAGLKIIADEQTVMWSDCGIETVRKTETYAGYDIVFESGLQYALHQTSLVNPDVINMLKEATSIARARQVLCNELRKQPSLKKESDSDLQDIAVGILLGYPDKAIIETLGKWDNSNPFASRLVDADIKGASYYACPQPVYSYPRSLCNDPTVQAHEELWSQVLQDYYTSNFHKSLESDPAFKEKLQELEMV